MLLWNSLCESQAWAIPWEVSMMNLNKIIIMHCIEGTKNNMNNLEMTEIEKALIMGTLLGDAHIQKRQNSYRLKIEHAINQKAYVLWKHKMLERFCTTTQPPKIVTSKKGFSTVVFYTTSGQWLKEIYHLFYKEKNGRYVKTITPELIENLPLSSMLVAVFFMDDGSVRNDCYAGKLATQGFSLEENHLLCSYLKKWNSSVECVVVAHKVSKGQYYISIPAKSFGKFVKEIEPIVLSIPDMVYKLNDQRKPRND
jgi:hypothetical protein